MIAVAASPLDRFTFVDTAVGGANRRNNIKHIDEFVPPAGAADVFRTYFQYTDDVVDYVAHHLNDKGKPSIGGYRGPAVTQVVPVDADSADAVDFALGDARTFANRFCARFDVPREALAYFFSGNKGFSIEIPASLFGGVAPQSADELARRIKMFVLQIAGDLSTIDPKIYDPVRLWRIENTIHGKSRLFKIPLTAKEFFSATVEEIRALASTPRSVSRIPSDEWEPRPRLVTLWHEAAVGAYRPHQNGRPPEAVGATRSLSDSEIGEIVDLLSPHWTLGQKHDLALCLAGYLGKAGVPRGQALVIAERLSGGDERPDDRISAVHDTYERISGGQDVLGFQGLRELLLPDTLHALERLIGGSDVIVGGPDESKREPVSLSNSHQSQRAVDPPWPTLDEAALHGLAGDVVDAIDTTTEADKVATLITYLLMFGNAVGRSAHLMVGNDRHGTNEFAVLVGETSKARKGSSRSGPQLILERADKDWVKERIQGGLSSGEGLIAAVADPLTRTNRKGETETVIEGTMDKRLFLVEEEFSLLLKVSGREGNTLSETVRRSWDARETLRTMTKSSPLTATGAHISILGHITVDEYKRELDDTARANGLANRFMIALVRRSKAEPFLDPLPDGVATTLGERTRNALVHARKTGRVQLDAEARELWREVYPDLSEGKPGLVGSLTARAEAHALRLALIYAMLDCAPAIRSDHLIAALALIDYVDASTRHVFGDATGNPIADRILTALRANGPMDQTAISEVFGRHVGAAKLGQALETLIKAGKIRSTQQETGGRPRTVWEALP